MSEEVAVYHTDNQLPMQYSLDNMESLILLAKEIQRFVKEQNLSTKIKGKDYAKVEAWQFAYTCLGLRPVIQEPVENLSNEKEKKFLSRCILVLARTGDIFGYGESLCSSLEENKKGYDEFAIHSTAQTRSIGKAGRNSLGWLMKASGFEPISAEEMEFDEKPKQSEVKPETKLQQPQPAGTVSNDRIMEIIQQFNGRIIEAIHQRFQSEKLHENKKRGIIKFYEANHDDAYIQFSKSITLETIGDALALMQLVPDDRVHPIHIRYWTEAELVELVASLKEEPDATNKVESE